MQREQRLVALDELTHRARADGDDPRLAAVEHDTQVVGQLRRAVEAGVVRRTVQVEDGRRAGVEAGRDPLEPREQSFLRLLARAPPRGRVRPRRGEQLHPLAEVDHPPVRVHDLRRLERLVDVPLVVVPGHDEAADARAGEALLRERDPAAHLVAHEPAEHLVAVCLVALEPLVLGRVAPVRVEAVEPHALLELGQLVVGHHLVAPEHARAVAAPAERDHGHHHLAGQIAAEDERVSLVELRRAEELAPALLGAVDVAGVVDPHFTRPGSRRSASRRRRPAAARSPGRRSR
jgi:hypothetical protein